MAAKKVLIPLTELTERQLLMYVVLPQLNSMENKMSDLSAFGR